MGCCSWCGDWRLVSFLDHDDHVYLVRVVIIVKWGCINDSRIYLLFIYSCENSTSLRVKRVEPRYEKKSLLFDTLQYYLLDLLRNTGQKISKLYPLLPSPDKEEREKREEKPMPCIGRGRGRGFYYVRYKPLRLVNLEIDLSFYI